jgi:hypothetical protein
LNAWVCRAASHAKGNAASVPSDEDEEVYLEDFLTRYAHLFLSVFTGECMFYCQRIWARAR